MPCVSTVLYIKKKLFCQGAPISQLVCIPQTEALSWKAVAHAGLLHVNFPCSSSVL